MIQNQAMLGVLSAHPSYLNAYAPMPYRPVVGGEAKRSDYPRGGGEVVAWLAGDSSGVRIADPGGPRRSEVLACGHLDGLVGVYPVADIRRVAVDLLGPDPG